MTKTHKVGTITLGITLITFGVLFLLRIFIPGLSYEIVVKMWPVIFIILGLEILIASFSQKEDKLVYDKTAIFLTVVLTFFAMGMAVLDCFIQYFHEYAGLHL